MELVFPALVLLGDARDHRETPLGRSDAERGRGPGTRSHRFVGQSRTPESRDSRNVVDSGARVRRGPRGDCRTGTGFLSHGIGSCRRSEPGGSRAFAVDPQSRRVCERVWALPRDPPAKFAPPLDRARADGCRRIGGADSALRHAAPAAACLVCFGAAGCSCPPSWGRCSLCQSGSLPRPVSSVYWVGWVGPRSVSPAPFSARG